MNNTNPPPPPEGSTSILVTLNSILESLNLIPSSRCSGFVYKIEKDSDVMLIELIKNNDCPNNEEMEGDDDVLDEEEFGGDHFNKFPTRSELAYHKRYGQVEEGPTNFALMAYSSISSNSDVSTDLNCLKYVEARLLVYTKNESVYEEDIKVLKHEIHLREVDITELRRKLELAQKQKDEIQLTVENFENSSKNLSKLIDCQIVDKCKTGLGYNVVPPPYTGNFMPPKPNLSFSSLEEFTSEPIVTKPVVETSEAKASEQCLKDVRENNGCSIIKDG
ncbi:hypothetical protein Tco_1151651 [Tanacetum coccineum]